MYNPYANPQELPKQEPFGTASNAQQFQSQAYMNANHHAPRAQTANINTFFNDPAAQMGLQFSQSAFNASHQYMQQNFGQLVANQDIKYYFKVSNQYVLSKLLLILFPFRNKTWTRQLRSTDVSQSVEMYATPIEDVNAPDLYIPLMSFVSYVLLWAVFSGINGTFHPQLLGYATTRTLAFYLMDICLIKISFYVLGVNQKNRKLWDLVSYSGYKFISILVLMLIKNLLSSKILIYTGFLANIFSLGFFLMRSLKYVVLPSGLDANSLSSGARRIRTQFLFVYSFVVQAIMVWVMA
ncbi:hypothetical protein KL918_003407 [Ogataea parapolymorpha]|uniref:Protein YIF1 n=1 Tax=Ogataea parapolymorpha (strain ATCC 26012 / BCRC 20466 / JCM 22074 / NRRL Y-7560 / DL-1) TaxID=871575 RepID=W1Q922_OGAPD|nr:Integral membrane protein [Ogataea parapolymorpha DL-1]ESW95850.1 Integral membrane protein [Ogataea parapolymorpha DL-1]KAG7866510.1 hypothetical protein KL918_003407 [Ogataea parapolymorpha]KAG7872554.1 hypothetical protein KL916_002949 [Ogataea parapolymorpha]KAG7883483.1 hypothetical protein KL938_002720 [Ogataea parapolymorpha]